MRRSPERTCVGCFEKRGKEELVRLLVDNEGVLVVDVDQRIEGRGSYICPRRECMKKAIKKGRLSRSLGGKLGKVLPDELEAMIKDAHSERLFSLLHFTRRMRRLILGREAVERELRKGRVHLLILACDLAQRSKSRFSSRGVAVVEVGTMEEYGRAFLTRPVGVIGITEEGLARRLFFVAEKLAQLNRGNERHV